MLSPLKLRCVTLALFVATLPLARPARTAEPARPDPASLSAAKQAFENGKSAFDRGEFETALSEFQRADALAPAPKLSYNVGNCLERLGRYADAALNFERFLSRTGTPTNDEDKQFADNLRARIAADRKRALEKSPDAPTAQPQAIYVPYPPPTGYSPYYAYPPQPQMSMESYRRAQFKAQHARRTRAIALMAVGLALNVVGVGLTGYAFTHLGNTTAAGIEAFVGLSAIITGIPLWIPGAVSYVQSNNLLKELAKPAGATPGVEPHAFIFSVPVLRF